jgi:hypothetical protein
MIASSGGNVLAAIGQYNGWVPKMTIWSATKAKDEGRCAAQNNLDYIYQFVNGWMLGKDAYSMGKYCESVRRVQSHADRALFSQLERLLGS